MSRAKRRNKQQEAPKLWFHGSDDLDRALLGHVLPIGKVEQPKNPFFKPLVVEGSRVTPSPTRPYSDAERLEWLSHHGSYSAWEYKGGLWHVTTENDRVFSAPTFREALDKARNSNG